MARSSVPDFRGAFGLMRQPLLQQLLLMAGLSIGVFGVLRLLRLS